MPHAKPVLAGMLLANPLTTPRMVVGQDNTRSERMSVKRSSLAAAGTLAVALAGVFACKPIDLGTLSEPFQVNMRPECPSGGMWDSIFVRGFGKHASEVQIEPGGQLSASVPITDIVEFHDCQQFIVKGPGSQRSYSSLFAIFARAKLDTTFIVRGGGSPSRPVEYNPDTLAIPMATIFSYKARYEPLGLEPGFNCLYFLRNSANGQISWSAHVLPVKYRQKICKSALQVAALSATTRLAVRILPPASASRMAVPPPVARWDWDEGTQKQYIGIRCGDSWCEVQPILKSGENFAGSRSPSAPNGMSKGWYDEQTLAVPGLSEDAPPQVSAIVGTIVPDSLLDDGGDFVAETSPYSTGWKQVARIGLNAAPGAYTSKLNLVADDASGKLRNMVELCFAGGPVPDVCQIPIAIAKKCGVGNKWFGRISHPGVPGDLPVIFCATRHGHEGTGSGHIPGTARWRWVIKDETMWVRCNQGCCQLNAD
jgi:hypothetical protein